MCAVCAAVLFVVVAIVPTSVGIRGTEVQFLAGGQLPRRSSAKKAILKETTAGATRRRASLHLRTLRT